jgi:hypothetical protein
MNYGFIYCLGNEAMPGIYKIGMTDRAPSQRCFELSNTTSAAKPFDLLCYGEVNDALRIEKQIHADFARYRINRSREFFALDYRAICDEFTSHTTMLAETPEGMLEAKRLSLMMGFYGAQSTAEKIEMLLAALNLAGIRIWSDGDIIRTSRLLSLESWMTGAVSGLKKDLLPVIPKKEPVTRIMTLLNSQKLAEQSAIKELDW